MSVLETQFSGDTILLVFPDGTSPALLMCLMAGIPVNRVHEFDFQPGEIRYDVKMKTILKSTTSGENLQYVAAIERGREKLKKARDDPNQFIDAEEEGDVYYQPVTRTKSHEKRNDENVSPSQYLSLFGIGLLGSVSKLLNPSEEIEEYEEKVEEGNLTHNSQHNTSIENSPELRKMEELVAHAPFEIPEINEKESELERIEKANIAMDEYLNKDDGGEDWISVLNDLMHEEK